MGTNQADLAVLMGEKCVATCGVCVGARICHRSVVVARQILTTAARVARSDVEGRHACPCVTWMVSLSLSGYQSVGRNCNGQNRYGIFSRDKCSRSPESDLRHASCSPIVSGGGTDTERNDSNSLIHSAASSARPRSARCGAPLGAQLVEGNGGHADTGCDRP
jgi:hypothetical protein